MRFQAIDNSNVVIENFFEGQAPQTLEGAAQAFVEGFPADYSAFSEQELRESWEQQQEELHILRYGE